MDHAVKRAPQMHSQICPVHALSHGSYDYSVSQNATGAEYSTTQRPAVRLSGLELGIRDRQFLGYIPVSAELESILRAGQLLQGSQRIGPHNGKNSFYA